MAMDPHKGSSWRCPTDDVLVDILLRLPPNTRRLFRLVCRHWRKLVDKRCYLHRTKTLVVTEKGSPFVMDDQTGQRKNLWSSSTPPRCRGMRIIGTCNGLICLCDDGVPGGAITVANPVTGETLDLPPLPLRPRRRDSGRDQCHRWHQAYGFGYHPTTGRYKVVHLPCQFDKRWEFNTAQVFTLGEASWRDVVNTVPGLICELGAGIVEIAGTMYWTTTGGKLMSFDLENHGVSRMGFTLEPKSGFLAVVHGALGIVCWDPDNPSLMDKIEVWTMKTMMGKTPSFSNRYSLEQARPYLKPVGRRPRGYQRLTRPHFAQDSGHVLTYWPASTRDDGGLYKHEPTTVHGFRCSMEINEKNQGTRVADIGSCSDTWAFKYVETKESLSAYRLGDR